MSRRVLAAVVAVLATFVSANAEAGSEDVTEEQAAQLTLNCGEIKNLNNSYQFGNNLWLEYVAQTRRPVHGECPWLSVGVEAYVVGVSGSGLSHWDMFTAVVRRQVPVPSVGRWQVNSNHYRSWFWYFTFSNGTETSHADVTLRSDSESTGGSSDQPNNVSNDPTNPNHVSPIVIDAGRNGYRFTSVAGGVLFDLDADGHADRVAWTDPDGDEEFLAFDRNGNGRIDDGSELFGNHTPVYPGEGVSAANGFEALKFMEGPSFGRSTIDGVVDLRDVVFARLLLWRDANHNGLSEPDELRPVSGSALRAIRTDYQTSGRRDQYGNEFRQRAKGVWDDGEFFIYDVWLKRQ